MKNLFLVVLVLSVLFIINSCSSSYDVCPAYTSHDDLENGEKLN